MNNEKGNMQELPVYCSPTAPLQMNTAQMNHQPPQYYPRKLTQFLGI